MEGRVRRGRRGRGRVVVVEGGCVVVVAWGWDEVLVVVGGGRCVDSVGCCHAHLHSLAFIPAIHSHPFSHPSSIPPRGIRKGGHVTPLAREGRGKEGTEA